MYLSLELKLRSLSLWSCSKRSESAGGHLSWFDTCLYSVESLASFAILCLSFVTPEIFPGATYWMKMRRKAVCDFYYGMARKTSQTAGNTQRAETVQRSHVDRLRSRPADVDLKISAGLFRREGSCLLQLNDAHTHTRRHTTNCARWITVQASLRGRLPRSENTTFPGRMSHWLRSKDTLSPPVSFLMSDSQCTGSTVPVTGSGEAGSGPQAAKTIIWLLLGVGSGPSAKNNKSLISVGSESRREQRGGGGVFISCCVA